MIEVTTPELERERTLYVYSRALDEGDAETLDRIMTQAETDPELARAIQELDEAEMEEIDYRARCS